MAHNYEGNYFIVAEFIFEELTFFEQKSPPISYRPLLYLFLPPLDLRLKEENSLEKIIRRRPYMIIA